MKSTALLLLMVFYSYAVIGQSLGWERADVFGTQGVANVQNEYGEPLLNNNSLTMVASYPYLRPATLGGWVRYDLNGNLQWRRLARPQSYIGASLPWGAGTFTAGIIPASNALQMLAQYYWLRANGDTARVVAPPATYVSHWPMALATRHGRYYIAGGGDGSGTGQQPLALHYSLVCIDSAGSVRWQRQYLNPAIRLGNNPQFVGGYSYLHTITEAPRDGWLLLGHTQRDSTHFQPYAIEVDSVGQVRRTRWVEPFGRRASVRLSNLSNAVRLSDGSGYAATGIVQFDTLGTQRTHAFIMKLDTALRVVWRYLMLAPDLGTSISAMTVCRLQEIAGNGLAVLAYQAILPRPVLSELEIRRLNRNGQEISRDVYCSQICTSVTPYAWQYLPDSSVVIAGYGEQRRGNSPTGTLLATPAWLARFAAPCRRTGPLAVAVPAGPHAGAHLALWPQPAAPGEAVQVSWQGRGSASHSLRLLDALGRVRAEQSLPAGPGGVAELLRPPGLAAGLYVLQLRAAGQPVATHKLQLQ